LGPLAQWGLTVENQKIVTDPTTGSTGVPGIYGAGDVVTYDHKLKLIMTGFAEVAQAMYAIKGYLFPHLAHTFQHSTSTGVQVL
jgi:thioredoxin reductase (NADPH)